jgi:hypothetical protein
VEEGEKVVDPETKEWIKLKNLIDEEDQSGDRSQLLIKNFLIRPTE